METWTTISSAPLSTKLSPKSPLQQERELNQRVSDEAETERQHQQQKIQDDLKKAEADRRAMPPPDMSKLPFALNEAAIHANSDVMLVKMYADKILRGFFDGIEVCTNIELDFDPRRARCSTRAPASVTLGICERNNHNLVKANTNTNLNHNLCVR
eukprot:m.48739 g.48739  ORF g.48739 m.48739 type:complete len:156 (-) comp20843_c0_seq1:223-690(-)